jgi:crossover junction endodeoxyribonuclease RuvC
MTDQSAKILGVDPGLEGAFAILSADGDLLLVDDLPTIGSGTQRRIDAANLAVILRDQDIAAAVVEQVGARPGQGVSSMFRFGQSLGTVAGVIGALSVPLTWTSPASWKKAMSLNSDAERSRQAAIERWPSHAQHFGRNKDHNRAEAALLALWAVLRGGR